MCSCLPGSLANGVLTASSTSTCTATTYLDTFCRASVLWSSNSDERCKESNSYLWGQGDDTIAEPGMNAVCYKDMFLILAELAWLFWFFSANVDAIGRYLGAGLAHKGRARGGARLHQHQHILSLAPQHVHSLLSLII